MLYFFGDLRWTVALSFALVSERRTAESAVAVVDVVWVAEGDSSVGRAVLSPRPGLSLFEE